MDSCATHSFRQKHLFVNVRSANISLTSQQGEPSPDSRNGLFEARFCVDHPKALVCRRLFKGSADSLVQLIEGDVYLGPAPVSFADLLLPCPVSLIKLLPVVAPKP
jgi:hypothetical protein